MGKLMITHLEQVSQIDWALRFVGPRADFSALIDELRADAGAYFDPDAASGKGAWIVEEMSLKLLASHFTNLYQKMRVTQARAEK